MVKYAFKIFKMRHFRQICIRYPSFTLHVHTHYADSDTFMSIIFKYNTCALKLHRLHYQTGHFIFHQIWTSLYGPVLWNWNSKANLSPETEKSNMATRQPFRKWGHWKSIPGSYSYTHVLGHWSFEFIFKAKLKLESGNQIIQYGCQAAILKVTSLKIKRSYPYT